MNSQHAFRLANAILQHGTEIIHHLRDFALSGYCQSAMYLHLGEDRLMIGLNGYDVNGMKLTRDQAKLWLDKIDRDGLDVVYSRLMAIYNGQPIKTNDMTTVISRPTIIHTKSPLHRSRKTLHGQKARLKGFERDKQRAAQFNKQCSQPSMMSHGRHRDKMPITIHTPKFN